jgi:hypothetical protein
MGKKEKRFSRGLGDDFIGDVNRSVLWGDESAGYAVGSQADT